MRNWLVSYRNSKEMTQAQVAEEAGMARTTYAMIETGDRNATVQNAKKIAQVLGFNWTLFFEDECHEMCKNRLHPKEES